MVVRLEGEINGDMGCSYSSNIKRQVCDRTYRL